MLVFHTSICKRYYWVLEQPREMISTINAAQYCFRVFQEIAVSIFKSRLMCLGKKPVELWNIRKRNGISTGEKKFNFTLHRVSVPPSRRLKFIQLRATSPRAISTIHRDTRNFLNFAYNAIKIQVHVWREASSFRIRTRNSSGVSVPIVSSSASIFDDKILVGRSSRMPGYCTMDRGRLLRLKNRYPISNKTSKTSLLTMEESNPLPRFLPISTIENGTANESLERNPKGDELTCVGWNLLASELSK